MKTPRLLVVVLALWATRVPAQDWVVGSRMPTARCNHALAYDLARNRLVVFGGDNRANAMSSTWEWDGVAWSAPQVTAAPRAANYLQMVFDPFRGETVLYGGFPDSGSAPLSDTWTWDGANWTRRQPATSPSMTFNYAMAADIVRGRIVLFGGSGIVSNLGNETWEWDGTNWQRRFPANAPSARAHSVMAFDVARGRCVLHGGSGSQFLGDTWEYDGTNWTPVVAQPSPGVRFDAAMAYDQRRSRIVLFGGAANTVNYLADTWEFDGTTWTQRNVSGPPASAGRMTYDALRQEVVLFGGRASTVPGPFGDLWAFDGAAWSLHHVHQGPLGRVRPVFAWDAVRGAALLFGGERNSAGVGDTWTWDGDWQQEAPLHAPSPRSRAAFATDTARNRIVLYGGVNGITRHSDTWEWNGADWLLQSTPVDPGARYGQAMAFDAGRQRCVMFGGTLNNVFMDDVWEWDGTAWTARTATVRPPARQGHAMAFDPLRARTVLYGGTLQFSFFTDTWEWDGTAWTQGFPATTPGNSTAACLAWDGDLGRVVMHTDRTWSWDGAQWTLLPTTRAVGAWEGNLMADDAGRIVAYARGEVLRLSTVIASASAAGSGCGGSLGVPVLQASDRPFLGNAAFRARLAPAASGAFTMLVGGFQPASVPLGGGCTLLVALPASLVVSALADAGGTATFALPIPDIPALRGVVVHVQAAALDPLGSLGGVVTLSNALVLAIGD